MKRPGIFYLRYLLLASAGVALIVCGIFLFAPSRTTQEIEPNIDALKQMLERRAEEALPLPSVSDDRIVLFTTPARFDSEVERVVGIATDLGGTALRSGEEEVLAQVPIENVPEFRARVTGTEPRGSDANQRAGEATQLIVVHLRQRASGASFRQEPSP